ncbi:hypothetical protein GQ457_01G010900 [Hibiscus cannabinus]
MFFDVLSPIPKPILPNSDPKTSESDLEPEFAYHDLIEGSVGRRDRPPVQLSSSRSAQPREPVITGIASIFLFCAGTCVLWTRVNATIMDTVPEELYTEYGWRVVLL